MTIDLRYRTRGLLYGEVPIKRTTLKSLEAAKRDRDHYLACLRLLATGSEAMRLLAEDGSEFAKGWLGCFRLLNETVSGVGQPSDPSDDGGDGQ